LADKHLLVEISGHGFGHLAQTAPVLNALRQHLPGIRLTVRTAIPRAAVARRIKGAFSYISMEVDPGLQMASAVHVRVQASHQAYCRYHADWNRSVEREAGNISRLKADGLLTNVSYRSLAAAARAGVPCAAMSSLNWADIYRHYCADESGADEIHRQIRESYRQADCFLALCPGLPMGDFANRVNIGPVAMTGRADAGAIRERLGVSMQHRLVLFALGGIPTPIDATGWPAAPHLCVMTDIENAHCIAGYHQLPRVDMGFIDLLASCDAVISKPGYGTFTEAACNGTRVIYSRRPDWPETPYLCEWLETHGVARAISWEALVTGAFLGPLDELLSRPVTSPPEADGIEAATAALRRMMQV
jgi:hypothetical protein